MLLTNQKSRKFNVFSRVQLIIVIFIFKQRLKNESWIACDLHSLIYYSPAISLKIYGNNEKSAHSHLQPISK